MSLPDLDEYPRRDYLRGLVAATAALAGCSGSDDETEPEPDGEEPAGNESDDRPVGVDERDGPASGVIADPPDRVYLPSHRDGTLTLSPQRAGDYGVMPHWTYPHTFWLTRGEQAVREDPDALSLHFMFSVWDRQTRRSLPVNVAGPMRVFKDGETVGRPGAPRPMISQSMGFHLGDNREFATPGYEGALPEEGVYEVELQLRPIGARKTGEFAGRFEEPRTVRFEFEFSEELFSELDRRSITFDEQRWGEPDAAELMTRQTGIETPAQPPATTLPPADEYPGELLGRSGEGGLPSSHDAQFVLSYLDQSRLSADDGGYLLVSPRTPYNRIPLPEMSLSVEGAIEGELIETVDDTVGHHYGLSAALEPGESFDLVIDSPPQVARHRGYQTAFLDMPPISLQRRG
ncbi:hypothetical protein GRX03_11255 [Halovenus sp. WSH3]|uniref:DUF7350 domain-containing protein n=1 Tax=Halovenus carboxidivorans TaxID=2692199 RepID=A0A6B0T2H7_9EURY|nr:hypothetical protein [Halovenus carboxidivorans]MXR52175.1 hypothetical protein [Halovenus carboxidivorans]